MMRICGQVRFLPTMEMRSKKRGDRGVKRGGVSVLRRGEIPAWGGGGGGGEVSSTKRKMQRIS